MSTENADSFETRAQLPQPETSKRFARTTLFDWLSAAFALVGLADAIYLTAKHLSGASVRCFAVAGCDAVLMSPYATLPGNIPLAALGGISYFTAFSLATLSAFGYARTSGLLLVLVGVMFLFTLWLIYLQAFVLGAFCSYCLLSAAITTMLLILQFARRLFASRAA